jgi:hypothetical protein
VIAMQVSCARRAVTVKAARRRHSQATMTPRHCLFCLAPSRSRAGRAAAGSLADIPPLCDEIERLNAVLARTRRRHQDLTAAARATLAADAEGEQDPLYYLRDELEAAQIPESRPWCLSGRPDLRSGGRPGRCADTASSPWP